MSKRAMAAWIGLALAGGGADARGKRPELVVTGDGVRPTTVAGHPARLRIDPSAPGLPMVNPGLARRAGLKGGMFGAVYVVGPVRIVGGSAVTRLDLGGGPIKRRVSWPNRDFTRRADMTVGPGGMPDPVIRFQLRAARAGERITILPMAPAGGLFGGYGGSFALAPIGGVPTRVRFNPDNPRTLATAGAGLALASAHGGRLEGEVGTAPVAFGVERPVRRMLLARPLAIGPLALAAIDVRVADFGNAAGIADADAPPPDPDEIVVTAKGKRDRSRDSLTLGRDQLDRCSSIVFDKPAKQVRLSCL